MASQTLRVLLAENSFTEAGLTLRALCADHSCGLELVFVSNPNKLRETLISSQPHVAVLALSMLQPDPPLAVSFLHQAAPHIPLILLARSADKGCALKCLSSGAENYMLEDYLDVQTLDHLLHTALRRNDSSDSPVVLKSQVSVATDLPNRSGLLRCVRASFQDSLLSASRLVISVWLSSLPRSRVGADQTAVTDALRHTTQLLRSLIRRSDLLAYVAPGVFVIVVFDAGDSCCASLQRRLGSRLLLESQRDSNVPPLKFFIRMSTWNGTSSHAFRRILDNHLSMGKQLSLSSLQVAGLPPTRSCHRTKS